MLLQLNDFLLNYGIKIGALQKILFSDDFSNGRWTLYEKAIQGILEGSFFGGGVYFDRVLLDNYAHNIIIEFVVDYGFFIGILLILLIVLALMQKIIFRR